MRTSWPSAAARLPFATAARSRLGAKPPFSVDASSPQVQTLIDIYNGVTGRNAKPFAMGGGTYARNFKSAVSFGPEDNQLVLPDWRYHARSQ